MKKTVIWLILAVLGGCFLVISHHDQAASVMAVHLLPPKIEQIKVEQPLDAVVALFPFEFDLKFSEEKEPVFLDYSHLPKEFLENLAVIFESALKNKVFVMENVPGDKPPSYYAGIIKGKKADAGIIGKVKKFGISRKKQGWHGSMEMEVAVVSHDGILLKKEKFEYNHERFILPEDVTMDYQVALTASTLFSKAYTDIIKMSVALTKDIEAHRMTREVVKKGIFTFRKSDKHKNKARLLLDIRVRIALNDFANNAFISREKISEYVNNVAETMKKSEDYRLVLSTGDKSETIYPFRSGKLGYDSQNDAHFIIFSGTKEFNVSPGKTLLIASFYPPKISEVITKGIYLDINPEKGISVGFNLLCDTKNNFVDMGFVK